MEGTFALDPPPPSLEFPFQGVFVIPPTPGIYVIFQLDWVPPGKNISLKNAVALNFLCEIVLKTIIFTLKHQLTAK